MNETAKGNYAISMWGSCDLSTFVRFLHFDCGERRHLGVVVVAFLFCCCLRGGVGGVGGGI